MYFVHTRSRVARGGAVNLTALVGQYFPSSSRGQIDRAT